MKVLLIAPCRPQHLWKKPPAQNYLSQLLPASLRRVAFAMPPLALPLIAALTHPEIDVDLRDEVVQEIDFNVTVDLVGISVMTSTAPRAYTLADNFRQRGVPVVLGGIHPSLLPQEAKAHADSVVIGEAEQLWSKVLEDFQQGELKPFYHGHANSQLNNLPRPRWELLSKDRYFTCNLIHATRGCPHDCSFCSVTTFYGHQFRYRPVKEVVAEIKQMEGRFFLFVDDNIVGHHGYSKKLLQELIPLKKLWVSQASLTVAQDEELLQLAAKSGCMGFLIGFESISPQSLAEAGKNWNRVENYLQAIHKVRSHSIGIQGSFVLGFDSDDRSIFQRTVDFIQKAKLEVANFCALTPFPGTRLHQKLLEENRIITRDWSLYDRNRVVFQPKQMTPEELTEGILWCMEQVYSWGSMVKRFIPDNLDHPLFYWAINLGYWKGVKRMKEGISEKG